jgi:hypothetical protein
MPVRVKSDAIGWRLVSLPDDGSPPDTTASDGVYWFRMSDAVGAHEGLLHSSDVVAFVFEINSVEYKSGGAPITDGVSAFYDAGAGVQPLSITLNPQNGNTQVTIP